jgi:hypothetical protein
MNLYLDTCSYGKYCDDCDRRAILSQLSSSGVSVLGSLLNAVEIIATNDTARRIRLASACQELRDKRYLLLDLPSMLIERSVQAFLKREEYCAASIEEKAYIVQHALEQPNKLSERDRLEIIKWKEETEESYSNMHETGRTQLQLILESIPEAKRPTSPIEFLQYYNDNPTQVEYLLTDLFVSLYGENSKGRVNELLRECGACTYYFQSIGFSIFDRGIRPPPKRAKKSWHICRRNPGALDIQQLVYLQACDIFVTDDFWLRRFLRRLAVINKNIKTLTYEQMKKSLCDI